MSSWTIGLASDVPAASSDCLNPGAAAMSALFTEAPKSPKGGRSVPTPRSQDPMPFTKLAKAGEPRYKFNVRWYIKSGYSTKTSPTASEMKTISIIMALLTAAREEDNRCDNEDVPGIFKKLDFTLLPSRWNFLPRFLKKRCADLSLPGPVVRRGGVRFVVSRFGRKTTDLVRYLQLVNRTMITLIGNRWSNGLMVIVNEKLVPGTRKVEAQAF